MRQFRRDFEERQSAPHVAVRGFGHQHQRIVIDLQAQRAQAPVVVGQCPLECHHDVVGADRVHHVHAAARQQRRIQFERRVLGGGADEHDHTALDVWQERILLGLVEAVHLVHEQHAAPALRVQAFRFRKRLAHVGEPREHRRDRLEMRVGVLRDQQRQRGLAATRRTPQHHRMHAAGFERTPERRAGTEQPILPDDFIQRARPHPLGQRLQRIGFGKQRAAGGTGGTTWHHRILGNPAFPGIRLAGGHSSGMCQVNLTCRRTGR
jgi:hypothetical protein